jgi:hypothetical protein
MGLSVYPCFYLELFSIAGLVLRSDYYSIITIATHGNTIHSPISDLIEGDPQALSGAGCHV